MALRDLLAEEVARAGRAVLQRERRHRHRPILVAKTTRAVIHYMHLDVVAQIGTTLLDEGG